MLKLSTTEKLQADCDMKAINIILQGLPTKIYSLVNHHRVAKDLWEKVQLLMQGNSLTKQERECKMYDAFDKFAHIKGESFHQYYLRFTQQINDVNIYSMKLKQFQVNTKFLNSLPPEWRTRANTLGAGGNYSGPQRVVKCFNCQGEGPMARQCPKPKRKRDATWFREKVLLSVITHNAAYQANDLDAYDSDYDKISTAKAVLMANLSSYGSDVLSEDTNSSAQQDAMILFVFEQLSEQVTNCNKVNKDNLMANESLSVELERYKEQEKNVQFADFEKEINNLKQTLSEQSKEKELLTKTFNVSKTNPRKKKLRILIQKLLWKINMKQALGFQNPLYLKKAQQIRPMLYDGNVIVKETNVITIADSEETDA
ncbi:retrovirus-related pol polyprotein from transposon TNT 1-94 [Tanacetum coccineum]